MRKIFIVFLIIILASSTVSASEIIDYNFEQLLEIYKNNSIEIEKIEIQNKLDEKTYKDSTEIYIETEDGIKSLVDMVTVYNTMIEQTLYQAEKADTYDTIQTEIYDQSLGVMVPISMKAKDYYLKVELPMLMNQKAVLVSTYKDTLKVQLDMYVPMETLKYNTSFLDKQLEQNLISSQKDFEEMCFQYSLAINEKELLEYNKEILQQEILVAKKQLEIGTIKPLQLHQKENELKNLNKNIIEIENSIDEYYNLIKASLGFEFNEQPAFSIPVNKVEALKPIDYNTYYSCVINGNLTLKTLNHQLTLLEQLDTLAKDVYEEDDIKLLLILKNNEKERINLNKSIQQMKTLINQRYNDYKIAYEKYLLAISLYDIAKTDYDNSTLKFKLGTLSDVEYQYKKLEYMEQENAFKNSILSYIKSYNDYEKAIYGIL